METAIATAFDGTFYRTSLPLSAFHAESKPLGLLPSGRIFFSRRFHAFSDFQGVDWLFLENLYKSVFFAAVRSGIGSSRLFVF